MFKYICKKILMVAVTLFVVSFVVFFAFNLIPGDPAQHKLGTQATPEKVEELRERMGLNEPMLLRYAKWTSGLLKGDFGKSYSYNMSVTDLIVSKIPINAVLSVMAILIVCLISIPLGIYTAKHTGSFIDRFLVIVNQICMSIPPFLLGIGITFLFGIVLHMFVPGAYISYQDNLLKFIGYLFFPAVAIAIPKIAMCIRLLRGNILQEAKQDYARTAYSRGNSTGQMLYKHVLKNAIMPTITFIGMIFADMIASSIIIEQIFGLPGLGQSLLQAISSRDYPVVEAIIMLIALGIVVISTVTDIIYAVMNPQVRLTNTK